MPGLRIERVHALPQSSQVAFQREVLFGHLLRLPNRLAKFRESLVQSGRLFGEFTGRSALLVHFGQHGIIRGGSWPGDRVVFYERCSVARSQVPCRAVLDPVNRMSFVHDERIARIDVTAETVLAELIRNSQSR